MEASNVKAMREALEAWLKAYDEFVCKPRLGRWSQSPCGTLVIPPISAAKLVDKTNAALAAPPRNCDVGTPEDQAKRYHATGQLYHTLTLTNALQWEQMPYEAKEGGAK